MPMWKEAFLFCAVCVATAIAPIMDRVAYSANGLDLDDYFLEHL